MKTEYDHVRSFLVLFHTLFRKFLVIFFISFNALTGLDSTSCFSGIGKTKCIKVLEHDEKFIEVAYLLAENDVISGSVKDSLEEYVFIIRSKK